MVCADKVLVIGHSGNLHVFNLAILLKSRKSDAREMFMFYSIICHPIVYVTCTVCVAF